MRTISAQQITDTVARLCIEANTRLPRDVQEALDKARAEEPWPLAKNTLDLLWSNLAAAEEEDLPICQDTGMACVFMELGTDVHIDGSFEAAIHEGVRRGYTDGYLRKSIVADPLRRGNTGDNTPAAITVHLVDGDGCTITVAPKGFGSENMSRIQMLKPADGVEGFKKFVIETVRLAGSNPCPPIVSLFQELSGSSYFCVQVVSINIRGQTNFFYINYLLFLAGFFFLTSQLVTVFSVIDDLTYRWFSSWCDLYQIQFCFLCQLESVSCRHNS